MKKIFLSSIVFILAFIPLASDAQLINFGKPSRFIDIDAKVLLGGSYLTQNYKSCYSQIADVDNSMEFAWGLGVGAKLHITSFVGIGTELNYLMNKSRTDLTINGAGAHGVSNAFIKNSYQTFNIPIFVTFNFNIAPKVKWNVDGGMYLAYGVGGKRKASVYSAQVNPVSGLLEMIETESKARFFNDEKAFINTYHRVDRGIHIATGLTFAEKFSIGIRAQFGLRNIARTDDAIRPSSHNIGFFGTIGYRL